MYERLALRDSTALSAQERRLVAIGGLRTEVNNGGFHQYFFNSAGDLVDVARDAARSSGASELADLVERSLTILNVLNVEERDERLDALDSIEPERFEELDEEFLKIEAQTDLDALMRAVLE